MLRKNLSQVTYCGGYSGGVPPLPIPNREVKPAIADGTAPPGGRVGSCRSSDPRTNDVGPGIFVYGRPWAGWPSNLPLRSMFLLLRAGFGRFPARIGRFCLIRASFGRFSARIERFQLSGASFERFLAREGKSLSRLVRDAGEIGLSLSKIVRDVRETSLSFSKWVRDNEDN